MLFAITGIDGSGKSTQIYLLKKIFREKGAHRFCLKSLWKCRKRKLGPFFSVLGRFDYNTHFSRIA